MATTRFGQTARRATKRTIRPIVYRLVQVAFAERERANDPQQAEEHGVEDRWEVYVGEYRVAGTISKGQDTATDKSPWKAWGRAPGCQDGRFLGSFYPGYRPCEPGGRDAALRAVLGPYGEPGAVLVEER
jgi:hypothetical protein